MYARYSEDDELRMYDDTYRANHRLTADLREEELAAERHGDVEAVLLEDGFDHPDIEALVELIMSPEMLRALGFSERWFYGHDGNKFEADDEQAAHLKAQRKPEQAGGMVMHRWERNGEWRAFDEKMAERAPVISKADAAKQVLDAEIAAAQKRYADALKDD